MLSIASFVSLSFFRVRCLLSSPVVLRSSLLGWRAITWPHFRGYILYFPFINHCNLRGIWVRWCIQPLESSVSHELTKLFQNTWTILVIWLKPFGENNRLSLTLSSVTLNHTGWLLICSRALDSSCQIMDYANLLSNTKSIITNWNQWTCCSEIFNLEQNRFSIRNCIIPT